MPKKRQPSDAEEIESIARMARESRQFYKGLAKTLIPRDGRERAAPESGDEPGREGQDQRK
jgi:hypothetical protein